MVELFCIKHYLKIPNVWDKFFVNYVKIQRDTSHDIGKCQMVPMMGLFSTSRYSAEDIA